MESNLSRPITHTASWTVQFVCGCIMMMVLMSAGSDRLWAQVAESGRPLRPSSRQIHGSIDGSQSNERADHSIARWIDGFSEQNPLGVEVYGYLNQGFTFNPDSPNDRINGPVENNYRSNAYQMNGLYLATERKIDPDLQEIQVGGRVDFLYGTDAEFGLSRGLDENIVSDDASRFYKLAFPQMYAKVFLPVGCGMSIKLGKFFSPIGNEWLYNRNNFFYSHFISWKIQPGSHTGLLVETELTDSLSFSVGPNLGWNTSENSNDSASLLAKLEWKPPDGRGEISFAIQSGRDGGEITAADSDVMVYALIVDREFGESWHCRLEHDLLISNSRTGTAGDNFEAGSLASYLFYEFNEQWRAGGRFEWLRDDDGIISGFRSTRPGAPGSFYNLTFGLNWHPQDHLTIRPEVRYDWQDRDSRMTTPAFDDGTSTTQWLFAFDILIDF